MPLRKFNYTGRTDIPEKEFTIGTDPANPGRIKISLDKDYFGPPGSDPRGGLDDHLKVYIEPKIGNMKTSIPCGTLGDIRRNGYTVEKDIGDPFGDLSRIRYDIFFVEEQTGLKIVRAFCDNLRISGGQGKTESRVGIVDVVFSAELNEIWKVEIYDEYTRLTLNSRFVNRENINGVNGAFILPAVLREVLIHRIFIDGVVDMDDFGDWQDFMDHYCRQCEVPGTLDHKDRDFDKMEVMEFIDCIVGKFIESTNIGKIIRQGESE